MLEGLREMNDRLSTDDAPLWAEVLGLVLAAAILLRGGMHVATALVASSLTESEIDPHLVGHGLTLASPVRGLRGHRYDRVARYLTGVIGIGGLTWVLYPAIPNPIPRAWVWLNCAALAADPLAWGVLIVRNHLTESTTMSTTTPTTDGGIDR